jgi:hypothetical protein
MSLIATAPAPSARSATEAEKVSAEIGRSTRLDRLHQGARLILGIDRRTTPRRQRPHVEHVEARLGQIHAVGDRLLRGTASGPWIERVFGDVDDPYREHAIEAQRPV